MQTAWRERNPQARIKAAKDAIGLNPECATAYILLAEEEVSLLMSVEQKVNNFDIFRLKTSLRRRSSSRKPSGSRRLTTGDPSSYSIRTN